MRPFLFLLLIGAGLSLSGQSLRFYENRQAATDTYARSPLADREVETGYAIYYNDYLSGQMMASGEVYQRNELTAAHRTLPLGTLIKVTRVDNGRSVTVRVNDRVVNCSDCVTILSGAAAQQLDLLRAGKALVSVQPVGQAPQTTAGRDLVARGQAAQTYNAQVTGPSAYDNSNGTRVPTTQPSYDYRPSMANRVLPPPQSAGQIAYTNPTASTTPPSYSNQPDFTSRGTYTTPAPTGYSESATPTTATANPAEVRMLTNNIQGYALQLGAYRDLGNAQRHVLTLQQRGATNVYLREDHSGDGSLIYRIVMAPFRNVVEAQNQLNNLRAAQLGDGIVMQLK